MQAVRTADAPAPVGHYAQAIVHEGLVFVAGQLPIVPGESRGSVGSIEEQTEQTLRNVAAILAAAGTGLDRVLQMTIYIADIDSWSRVNTTYARVMGDHRPARAVVPVKELHHGYGIEIQAIAALRA